MEYIEEEYVKLLIGNNIPMGTHKMAILLDRFLISLNESGDLLPAQLYLHNIRENRTSTLGEFAKVDADVAFEINNISKKLSIDLRDYRKYQEFARPDEEKRVVLHILIIDLNKTTWAIHLPLQCLMKGFGSPEIGYQCYSHGITLLDDFGMPKGEEVFYCGITSRNWLTRMSEHFRDIRTGSKKLFHKTWREYQGEENVLLNSELIVLNQNHDTAMHWEEWIVDRYKAEKRSLNMIPGGFKGVKFLHEHNYFSSKPKVHKKV